MVAKIRNNKDVVIASLIFIASVICCIVASISLVLPLLLGYVCYAIVAFKRGNTVATILVMSKKGFSEAMVVVFVLLLIGAVSAAWRASGTIAMIVHYGIGMIVPEFFLVISFLLCCVFAYALGSCFGVAGTIGIILVTIAKAGDVSVIMTAGAALSGGYFGDRFSPVSSSANLTAFVTRTDIYGNLKRMARTMVVPMIITIGLYTALSFANPLKSVDPAIDEMITANYNFSWMLLLPVVIMLVLPIFRVNVKVSAIISAVMAAALAVAYQGIEPSNMIKTLALGYAPTNGELANIVGGGGVYSMAKIAAIVTISCTYSEIIKQTGMFLDLIHMVNKGCKRIGRAPMMLLTGTLFSGLFCSQAVAILMNGMLLEQAYRTAGGGKQEMALDIENTTVLSATWAPWSVACMAAFSAMGVGCQALVFSFFVFVLPIYYLLTKNFAAARFGWYNKPTKKGGLAHVGVHI